MNIPAIIRQIDESNIIAKIALSLDSQLINEAIETWLLKTNDTVAFFSFLKEKSDKGFDTLSSENLFISLMGIHNFNLLQIEEFLKIINKTPGYIIERLCHLEHYDVMARYLYKVIHNSSNPLIDMRVIVPALTANYQGTSWRYMDYMVQIMCLTGDHIESLFKDCNLHRKSSLKSELQAYLLMDETSLTAISNYCDYLIRIDVNSFIDFDRQLIQASGGDYLLHYSYLVKDSNKRLVLRRLVELKEEEYLIGFIEMFPEYKRLLPML